MKRQAFAKRRDANEAGIVKVMRGMGATVMFLDNFDLLVGFQGRDYKIEVKMPKGKLEPSQVDLIKNWRGTPLHIVRSVDEAIAVLKSKDSGVARP